MFNLIANNFKIDRAVLNLHSPPTVVNIVKVKVNGVVWNQDATLDVLSIKKQLAIVG